MIKGILRCPFCRCIYRVGIGQPRDIEITCRDVDCGRTYNEKVAERFFELQEEIEIALEEAGRLAGPNLSLKAGIDSKNYIRYGEWCDRNLQKVIENLRARRMPVGVRFSGFGFRVNPKGRYK